MRELKRSKCAILPLVLKKKWYDMIASGEKLEEYRDAKPFWEKRIKKWLAKRSGSLEDLGKNLSLVIGFSCGYRKPDMFFLIRYCDVEEHSFHPEWGEPESSHFILSLGERVEIVSD